ncbi:MAG: hypothetical protein ACI9LM_000750 [Alteromonadaceae bacterium]|jgi:hypothetical protein
MKNLIKTTVFSLLTIPTLATASVWCIMDEISNIDTTGNIANHCWVSGKVKIDGVLTHISDISICSNPETEVNDRNLSLALTAFTHNKKLAFYFKDYSSCSEVLPRWEANAARIQLQN